MQILLLFLEIFPSNCSTNLNTIVSSSKPTKESSKISPEFLTTKNTAIKDEIKTIFDLLNIYQHLILSTKNIDVFKFNHIYEGLLNFRNEIIDSINDKFKDIDPFIEKHVFALISASISNATNDTETSDLDEYAIKMGITKAKTNEVPKSTYRFVKNIISNNFAEIDLDLKKQILNFIANMPQLYEQEQAELIEKILRLDKSLVNEIPFEKINHLLSLLGRLAPSTVSLIESNANGNQKLIKAIEKHRYYANL